MYPVLLGSLITCIIVIFMIASNKYSAKACLSVLFLALILWIYAAIDQMINVP